jgi:group I intron endonuclease
VIIIENCYTVYAHTNKLNGKKYIGITYRNVQDRWRNGKGYKTGSFRNSINKYGWDGFNHEILETNLSEEQAKDREIFYIAKYKTRSRKFGYNIHVGGDIRKGYKHTQEAKERISLASKSIPIKIRKIARSKQIITDEHKKHMSESRLGMKFSEEHLKNLSESHKGNEGYWKGKSRPTETGVKIGEKNSKRVTCIETGIVYKSVTEASKDTGYNISSISKWCRGIKPRYENITFKYCEG